MVKVAASASGDRPQGPGMVDDQRGRQQDQAAEQQRARRHHHRVVIGQPQSEYRGARKRDGGEQDDDFGEDVAAEAAQRIEPDDHGGSGEPQDGAGKLQRRGRFMPRDDPGDDEGKDRRRRGQHHGACRRHILLRPGNHQKRDRRIDGLLLGEQLPGAGIGRKSHSACAQDDEEKERGDQRARRDEGDRGDRTDADLGQRIGGAPAHRQRQQQGVVAPGGTGLRQAERIGRRRGRGIAVRQLGGSRRIRAIWRRCSGPAASAVSPA